jgi:U3 small nucleolar ribonucleoprotein component
MAGASPAFSNNTTPVAASQPTTESAATREAMNRLKELRAMDKSSMTREQKKAIRHELKSIKKSQDSSGGGVYLSAGAVILIIVLLIIFL